MFDTLTGTCDDTGQHAHTAKRVVGILSGTDGGSLLDEGHAGR